MNTTDINSLQPFSFGYLWQKALQLNKTDPTNPFIYHPLDNQSRLTFTYAGCANYCTTTYTLYSQQDVYDQVLLWRVPLIALLATATLPALGLSTKFFTILHLVADPIDALWSLLYKLQTAKRQKKWAQKEDAKDSLRLFTLGSIKGTEQDRDQPIQPNDTPSRRSQSLKKRQTMLIEDNEAESDVTSRRNNDDERIKQYDLEVIALIINAYQEWDEGEVAKSVLTEAFNPRRPYALRNAFRDRCARAAAFIAADRVSRSLPSVVATLVFFAQIASGFWRTILAVGPSYDPSNDVSVDINRTPYNLAFGTLYFWLPFAVLATAYVGSANTTNSVVRILERLRVDAKEIDEECREVLPEAELPQLSLPQLEFDMKERWSRGGLPTWQPDKFNDWDDATKSLFWSYVTCALIVAVPGAAAMWVSWRTPSEGFGCQGLTLSSFLASWAISHAFDWLMCKWFPEFLKWLDHQRKQGHQELNPSNSERRKFQSRGSQTLYWTCLVKDSILTAGAITILTWTSLGLFNSCNCWVQWFPNYAERYLSFPEEQFVFDQIKHRLQWEYAPIIGSVLLFEVLFFWLVAWGYRDGHRVLKQQDIEYTLNQQPWSNRRPFKWFKRKKVPPIQETPSPTRTKTMDIIDGTCESKSWWKRRTDSLTRVISGERVPDDDSFENIPLSPQAVSSSGNDPYQMSGAIQDDASSPTDISGPRQRQPTVTFNC